MKKVIVVLLLVAVLILTLAGPVLADKGGEPNPNAWWGQDVVRLDTQQHPPGFVGDWLSNGHEGWKDNPRAWGEGGIKENIP